MAQALFILVNTGELRPAEQTNLAALAAVSRQAGLTPSLLVVDMADAEVPVGSVADVFETVRRAAVPEGMGDGALGLDQLVGRAAAETAAALIVTASNISSRNWAARLAAECGATFMPACDEMVLRDGQLAAATPVMGGMVRKTVQLSGQAAVVLYAGGDLAFSGGKRAAPEKAEQITVPSGVTLRRREPLPDTGGIPLKGAATVVAGGLGIGSAENWSKIEGFANRVGAALGASRAAVDMGWVPSSRQVGFSGVKVAPDVYVAIGISGAVHHLAGIGGARRIVAVNKDPEAPIFRVADVAIVGDYDAILTAAHKKLDQA